MTKSPQTQPPPNPPPLATALVGETIGTYLLVLFGTGSVASAVLTGALTGLWQVAVVWGFGVTLAIYCSAGLSGAHLNPAVSLALAWRRPSEFPAGRLLPYWAAQLAGATLAGFTIWLLFGSAIERFERLNGVTRGAPGSERSAMVFGEYFPNPAVFGVDAAAEALVSPWLACGIEAFGTAVLVFIIFSLTNSRQPSPPPAGLAPFFIGFTVAALISLFAPLTQAGWNPARDFGPRIIAALAGWGSVAIPGPQGGFWIYIVGPLIGGPLGAWLYDALVAPRLAPSSQPETRS